MTQRQQLLLLELNEINFDFLEHYIDAGELPHFRELLRKHGYSETESEHSYEELEPWIQWVTAHTGLTYAQHGVFRLGDIVATDLPQIWEELEDAGLSVGAISPMNAKNRLKRPSFFIPDPWTRTAASASRPHVRFQDAISQAVNDNASGGLKKRSVIDFAVGGLRTALPGNYSTYLRLLSSAPSKPWSKALFLDQILADLFTRLVRQKRPDFASLFLNAGAHIQHHYMFNSAAYDGGQRNPAWYCPPDQDPVLDVYRLYDRILGQIGKAFPGARIMLATGLHQVAYGATTFYWRLIDHAKFLTRFEVPFVSVEPRMSRDFVVACASAAQAREAQRRLEMMVASDGVPLFTVENRGADLFVMLTYPHEISDQMFAMVGNERIDALRSHVAFVAIKNGEHDGIGYFADTGQRAGEGPSRFALSALPERIKAAFGLKSHRSAA